MDVEVLLTKNQVVKIHDAKYLAWQTKMFQPEHWHIVDGVYNVFLTWCEVLATGE